uniref:Uncharacterized protein n=2 Tax=Haplochromini TaxID=319058 RepID=A0A3Q2V064_HAPBU
MTVRSMRYWEVKMEARVTSKWLKISLTLASVHVSIIRRTLNNNGHMDKPEDIWNNAKPK